MGCVLYIYNPVSLIFDKGTDFCICFSRKELQVSHAQKNDKKKENEKKSTLSINIYFGVLFIKYILALSVH